MNIFLVCFYGDLYVGCNLHADKTGRFANMNRFPSQELPLKSIVQTPQNSFNHIDN